MKTLQKRLATVCCLFGAIFQLHAQGYIVPNGVVYIGGSQNEIDVLYNPSDVPPNAGDYTGFTFTPETINTLSYDYIVNVGIRTFLVSPNDPISLQAIQSGSYTELSAGNSYVFNVNDPFYVGLYTGDSLPQNGIYNDPVFGWAELENIDGTIELLDSALEYQGGGIYAGTDNIIPVPEPSGFALGALGALLLGFCRRRKSP